MLSGEKKLMPLSEVKLVTVPAYDELSVKNLYSHMTKIEEFMQYMPDKVPKQRTVSRCYFFNIMHSINPSYVQELIRHATAQRNAMSNSTD